MNGDLSNPAVQRMVAGSVALFAVFLAAWEWGPGLTGIPAFIIPPASQVWRSFLRMLSNDQLLNVLYCLGIPKEELNKYLSE